jgi:hypothetical protein
MDESQLSQGVEALNRVISKAMYWGLAPWNWWDPEVVTLRNTLSGANQALDDLRTFVSKTSEFFTEEQQAQQLITQGISSINSGSISIDGTYLPCTGDAEPWRDPIGQYIQDHPYHDGRDKLLNAPVPLTGQVITSEAEITPDSVNQGNAGDCWYMAVLAAMAATSAGKDKLYQNMRWDSTKHCYVVTLYYNNKSETYDVDTVYGDGGHGDSWGKPSWTSVYEDALIQYAQAHHGGNGVTWINSDSGSTAMEILTGKPAAKEVTFNIDDIRTALADGHIVTVGSVPTRPWTGEEIHVTDQTQIVTGHEYTVVTVDSSENITLRNPWGDGGSAGPPYITLSPDQFYAYFTSMSSGSV